MVQSIEHNLGNSDRDDDAIGEEPKPRGYFQRLTDPISGVPVIIEKVGETIGETAGILERRIGRGAAWLLRSNRDQNEQ